MGRTFPADDHHHHCHDGVFVVSGYNVRLAVERGHLLVEGGTANTRWTDRLSRVDRTVRRIIMIGSAGMITLDAIRWVHGVGIPLVHLDRDGEVLMVAAASAAHRPRVRRAQVLAAVSEGGLELSRALVQQKVSGQLDVLDRLDVEGSTREEMVSALRAVAGAQDFAELRRAEAFAAGVYWANWRTVRVLFAKPDRGRVPAHWGRFEARHSPLGGRGPIRAVDPVNAILNYCYAILEAEARIACLAAGLDPMLGILHTDRTGRDALALDVMEPVRPAVDRFVLDLLARRELSPKDLFERKDGQCRLLPPLAEELAVTAPRWARLVLPVALDLAERLQNAVEEGFALPEHHGKAPRWRRKRPQLRTMREFDQRPDPGVDPRYRGKAVRKRQRTLDRVYHENTQWTATHASTMTREEYCTRVIPAIAEIPLRRLMQATGLSNASCSKIRRGLTVPHARHWRALASLSLETRSN